MNHDFSSIPQTRLMCQCLILLETKSLLSKYSDIHVMFESTTVLMFESKKISDTELIKMIKQGEHAMNRAIEHILDTHSAKIEGYLMKQSGSPEEAEDALYEGIAAFIVNVQRGSFNGESTIGNILDFHM